VFFDLSPVEIVMLLGLAVVLFGPDRLPAAAMTAARVLRQIRALGETSREQVREQFGDEFADLRLDQFDPRRLVREHLGEEVGQMRGTLDEVRRDLRGGVAAGPAGRLARSDESAVEAIVGHDRYVDTT
jgi:sec-independent protein translocase protein TatB